MKYFFSTLLLLLSNLSFGQCTGAEPPYSLGADTTICSGAVLTLNGPAGYSNYQWSTGTQGASISLLNPGTYTVSSTIGSLTGPNLVLNGDFEGGTTALANNFTTAYTPGYYVSPYGILMNPSTYAITSSPNLVHTNFTACGDHTTGTGNMMVVNGSGTPNTTVWSQTVPVIQNQGYLFSFWVTNALSDPNVAQLQLFINNIAVSAVTSTPTTGCNWVQITGSWIAGSNPNAVLKIVNQNVGGSGNDFAIDDIVFRQVCTKTDNIVVAVNNVQVNAGQDISFCEGDSDTLVATTNNPANVLTWTPGNVAGNTLVPTVSGIYTVTATSPFNCIKTDNVNVNIRAMNWEIDPISSLPTDCGDSNGVATVLVQPIDINLPTPMPYSYAWSGPIMGNPVGTNTPVINDLFAGMYYVTVTSDGCSRDTLVEVLVNNAPIASISATPTSGYVPLSVSFGNNSQFGDDFWWYFGNGDSLNIATTDSVFTTYSDTGVYIVMMVANSGNCYDTTYITITVLEPPIVIPPPVIFPVVFETSNVFTPNGDGDNDFYTFKMENIVTLNVQIFNRWGNLMYQTSSPVTFFWDGRTPEGIESEDGTYFYKFKATGAQGENFEGNGFLHLFR